MNLVEVKPDLPPLQGKKLADSTAGLDGRGHERLKVRFRNGEKALPFPLLEPTITSWLSDEESLDRLTAFPERRRVHVVLVHRPTEEGAQTSQASADGRDAPASGEVGVPFYV